MNKEDKFQGIYEHIFSMPIRVYSKRMALERIAEYEPEFTLWPIIGITHAALKFLQQKDFSDFKGIERAHLIDRKDRGDHMFDCDSPIADAWEYYSHADRVVLATKSENSTNNLGPIINIDGSVIRGTFSLYMSKRVRTFLQSIEIDE